MPVGRYRRAVSEYRGSASGTRRRSTRGRRSGRLGEERRETKDEREREEKEEVTQRIWAVLEGVGLPNWLRKCNVEFYNVRIYTPSHEHAARVRRLARTCESQVDR